MSQPEYVPASSGDNVRSTEQLPAARRWLADRPGEIASSGLPGGRRFGNVGPDQGYALGLAKHFTDRLVLEPGEHAHDATLGALAVALKRAALYGRAPVIYDLEHAFTLWGFLGDAPAELIAARRLMFDGAAHHYWRQRDIADAVGESTLRLKPDEVSRNLTDWMSMINLGDAVR